MLKNWISIGGISVMLVFKRVVNCGVFQQKGERILAGNLFIKRKNTTKCCYLVSRLSLVKKEERGRKARYIFMYTYHSKTTVFLQTTHCRKIMQKEQLQLH